METTKSLVFPHLFTKWSDPPQNCAGDDLYPLSVQTWRWVDDTTATFTLRSGMRYQNKKPVNGREVQAQDVVFAFERFQKNLSFLAGRSAAVESVVAKDKYTFEMKLKAPWGGFVAELLANYHGPWVEPPEAGGPGGKLWERPEQSWVGSGPFMFDSWQPGVKWRLVRNPDYWVDGRPYLEAIEYPVMPEASTQLAALRSGKINLIQELSEELLDVAVREIPRLQVVRCPGSRMSGAAVLWINNSGPPFDDVRVRRAVRMSIDQNAIIKNMYKGRATFIPVLAPSVQYAMKLEDFPAEVRQYLGYDPNRAKQLLVEAGYPNGLNTVINFTARYAAPANMVAEAVTAMLAEGGIRAKLNMMEYARFLETVSRAKYPVGELAISAITAQTPEDAHALNAYWSKAGTSNRSMVQDPEYDRIFEQFRTTTDNAKRAELARQMQTMAAARAYTAWLPFGDSTMLALPGVHFTWVGNRTEYSMLMETAWIE